MEEYNVRISLSGSVNCMIIFFTGIELVSENAIQ